MAKLTPVFSTEAERIHREHADQLHYLAELDRALDHLNVAAEGDSDAFSQVHLYGRLLTTGLPEHFLREERALLDTVAEVSPQLAEFAREMKREHEVLCVRMAEFCRALDEVQDADDPSAAMETLRAQGKELTGELGRHIALEEHELSGFL
jgi:hemerythrin-like domain-containing protein